MATVSARNIAVYISLAFIATPQVESQFRPQSINGTALCGLGPGAPLDLASSLLPGEGLPPMGGGACVPSSVRCALTCQQHAPNCTCFNYYSANGSCEFFGGSNVSVTVQQGCTLWTVGLSSSKDVRSGR